MILSYSRTSFVPAIIQNIKKHTLRRDILGKWKAGMKIQHWLGNPRNTKSTPPPFKFHEGVCFEPQPVFIRRDNQIRYGFEVFVGLPFLWKILNLNDIELLCRNDGLTPDEFRDWFLPPGTDEWEGNIIHFTPLRYAT